ncbi:MAG: SDR family NAD(P)-dependent oxidoreductase [Kiloniellaceae bacterium]
MSTFATYPSLKDRVVFVTGGGSGIGASIVEHFCAQGSNVGFVDIAEPASRKLVDDIQAKGHPAPAFKQCDLRDVGALRRVIGELAEELGTIAVLVNNAASDDRHPIDEVTEAYWEDRMQTNLRHQFFAAQAVYKGMKDAGGGAIINMGSISWHLGQGGMPAYVTAKAAIEGLTSGLARDFGPYRIRVNCVIPGWIMTRRQMDLWLTPEAEQEMLKRQCLKEKLYPPDIARMVLWLAADDGARCTARCFYVDGGWV